ncbi:MAG: Os1348 family NHLP clan protein [Anaerolineales bacterium]
MKPAYQYLLGLALSDEDFRRYLLEDPVAAAQSVGIKLSQRQADKIMELNQEEVQGWLGGAEPVLNDSMQSMSGW